MEMRLLLKNGHLVDPIGKKDGLYDILIEDDKVVKVQTRISDRVDKLIDASDCLVMPGLIDMHTHVREPGYTEKETFVTAGRAAVKGGFTTICAAPDTKPVIDTSFLVGDIRRQAENESLANVLPVGALSTGLKGKQGADLEGMAREGAVAFSDETHSLVDMYLLRQLFLRCARLGLPVFSWNEDRRLSGKGVMNAGKFSKSMGLAGIPGSAEETVQARYMLLAEECGCQLHLQHMSTRKSVLMLWLAKKQFEAVTGEVCPHHLFLTEECLMEKGAAGKVYPPLRTEEDRLALIDGLRDGIIDVIATDHSPHEAGKWTLEEAPSGFSGLETALPLVYTGLVKQGLLSASQMVEKMSSNPARILKINRGSLNPGDIADITVFDPRPEYDISTEGFASLGKNTPFEGYHVSGRVTTTLVSGRVVYRNN